MPKTSRLLNRNAAEDQQQAHGDEAEAKDITPPPAALETDQVEKRYALASCQHPEEPEAPRVDQRGIHRQPGGCVQPGSCR